MPQHTVGTTAQRLAAGIQQPRIHNLGPGDVGLAPSTDVTLDTADLYLKPGEAYEFPTDVATTPWLEIYAIASAAGTDVRVAERS